MKKYFTLLLTSAALCGTAQSDRSSFGFKTAVSFNPTVLLATDNTAMVGAEYRLKGKLALVLDAGYIFDTRYFRDDVLRRVGGFAFRPGLKLYTKAEKRAYFQFLISYKQVDYKIEDWLGKACVNEIPAYEQLQNFTYRKKTLSFALLAGQLFRISDGVLLELYAGVGVKIKDQQPTEKESCYRNAERGFLFSTFQEHSVTATVPFGIKILVPVKQ